MDVYLLIYDLSGGMARQMSMQLLGFQLDAIYHTSIELQGREWVYDGGIVSITPGSSHLGRPMERLHLGKTELTMDVIQEYLESVRPIFTAEVSIELLLGMKAADMAGLRPLSPQLQQLYRRLLQLSPGKAHPSPYLEHARSGDELTHGANAHAHAYSECQRKAPERSTGLTTRRTKTAGSSSSSSSNDEWKWCSEIDTSACQLEASNPVRG